MRQQSHTTQSSRQQSRDLPTSRDLLCGESRESRDLPALWSSGQRSRDQGVLEYTTQSTPSTPGVHTADEQLTD